jgi:hypothetical protein
MTHVSMTPTSRPVLYPDGSNAKRLNGPSRQRQTGRNPKFGGLSLDSLEKRLDFKQMGASHINQIQVIYAACILWRLVAANERRKASPSKSFNEIRESILRDSMGYFFWFFATPILQRAYLGLATPKEIRNSLIQANPKAGKGLNGFLNQFNPLSNWNIPSSEQVKDQMEQALVALKGQKDQMGKTTYEAAKKSTEKFYSELMKHRNIATAVGLGATIALLGIGINLLNFHMTRKNVERRKAELLKQKNTMPPPPRVFGQTVGTSPLQFTPSPGTIPTNNPWTGVPLQQASHNSPQWQFNKHS